MAGTPPPTPPLRTRRLRLDPLDTGDAGAMVGVLADPSLYVFIGGEPPDLAALRQRYARLVEGRSHDGAETWHNWTVRTSDGGATNGPAVGTVQATIWAGEGRAAIAWLIGVPWQGQGYASEAAGALVTWLDQSGVRLIEAYVHPGHAASAAVAAHAGLVQTDASVDGERVWRRVRPEGATPPGGPPTA